MWYVTFKLNVFNICIRFCLKNDLNKLHRTISNRSTCTITFEQSCTAECVGQDCLVFKGRSIKLFKKLCLFLSVPVSSKTTKTYFRIDKLCFYCYLVTTWRPPGDYGLTTVWPKSDNILTTFWLYFDYILATFWLQSDYTVTTFWLGSDYILTIFWLYSAFILPSFWLHSVYILTTLWLFLTIS